MRKDWLIRPRVVLLEPFDLSPHRAELLLDFFVAAIEMVNTIDDSDPVSNKSGKYKRRTRTQIRCNDRGTA